MSTAQHGPQSGTQDGPQTGAQGMAGKLAIAWAVVGIPLAYGIYETALKAAALFTG